MFYSITLIVIILLILICVFLFNRLIKVSTTFRKKYQDDLNNAISREKELAKREAELNLKDWIQRSEKYIREDAVRRSRSSVVGKVTEHLIPYFGQFEYNPKDVRFLGTPVDLVIFNGMDEGNIREIVFAEIKTGDQAQLTTRERQIRNLITENKIKWKLIRVNRQDENSINE
jgi:predicted Holliday junction resolvase-like endonuclease